MDLIITDKLEATILLFLSSKEKDGRKEEYTFASGITVADLMLKCGISLEGQIGRNKLYKKWFFAMKKLEKHDLVKQGLKRGKQLAYYPTQKGYEQASYILNIKKRIDFYE